MRGGAAGAAGRGAVACSQVSQCGFLVRPSKGLGSRWRFGTGGVGSGAVGHTAVGSLGHAHWSMRHSHTRATSCALSQFFAGFAVIPFHNARMILANFLIVLKILVL